MCSLHRAECGGEEWRVELYNPTAAQVHYETLIVFNMLANYLPKREEKQK